MMIWSTKSLSAGCEEFYSAVCIQLLIVKDPLF